MDNDKPLSMHELDKRLSLLEQEVRHHVEHDLTKHTEFDSRIKGMWERRVEPLIKMVDELAKKDTYGAGFKAGMVLAIGSVWAVLTFGFALLWSYLSKK